MNQPKPPLSKPGFTCVGIIIGAHGIKGEVRIRSLTDIPTDLTAYGTPCTEQGVPFALSHIRPHTSAGQAVIIARAGGVKDRTTAEGLKGTALYVPFDALSPLEEGEVYMSQLENAQVVGADGSPMGRVVDVFDNGAHTVVEVRGTNGKTALLPYIDGVVESFSAEPATLYLGEDAPMFFDIDSQDVR